MIESILEKIGLNDKETRVYLACLKSGPSPVRKIALAAEVNRGTAYDILRSLIDLGLVSYYHKAKRQYFIAEDPERLNDVLEKRKNQLEQVRTAVAEIIPELRSIHNNAEAKPVVKLYDGDAGIKIILQDVLQTCRLASEHEYFVYSSSTIKNFLYKVYPNFSTDRIKAGINVKVVSIGPGGETRGLDQRKWLTKKEGSPTYTIIYSGKVAMISVDDRQQPIGVMIEDAHIFQTQKILFEHTWNNLPR